MCTGVYSAYGGLGCDHEVPGSRVVRSVGREDATVVAIDGASEQKTPPA